MASLEDASKLFADRNRSQWLKRRITKPQPQEPAFYLGYDAELERHAIGQRSGVSLAQSLSNAGQAGGQPVELSGPFFDAMPRVQIGRRPAPVFGDVDIRWSLILQHYRKLGVDGTGGSVFDTVYWEYNHLGQVRPLLTVQHLPTFDQGGQLNASFNQIPWQERMLGLDETGLSFDLKRLTQSIGSGSPAPEGGIGATALDHIYSGMAVPESQSWRKVYANLPWMTTLYATPPTVPGPERHPCIVAYERTGLRPEGLSTTALTFPNFDPKRNLLFLSSKTSNAPNDTSTPDDLIFRPGTFTTNCFLRRADDADCEAVSPDKTVAIEVPNFSVNALGITDYWRPSTSNIDKDFIFHLFFVFWAESLD